MGVLRAVLTALLLLLSLPCGSGLAKKLRNWRRITLNRRIGKLPDAARPKLRREEPEDPAHSGELRTLKDFLTIQELMPKRKPPQRPEGVGLDAVVPVTDLEPKERKVCIVTTATLPWMTGTAVNPLLRAAHLTASRDASAGGRITLMVPWLDAKDQNALYPKGVSFSSQDAHREYLQAWVRDTAKMPAAAEALEIRFYNGRYHPAYGSIFPVGDIVANIPDEEADICVLEEPEHLNWYRFAGVSWRGKFKHVVGVMHTNYLVYSQDHASGRVRALLLLYINQWMCRAHCDRIIKLSSVLQDYALEKETVCNVHGVRGDFIRIGEEVAAQLKPVAPAPSEEPLPPPPPQRFSSYSNMTQSAKALRLAIENLSQTLAGDVGTRGAVRRRRRNNPMFALTRALKEYQGEFEAARQANLEARLEADPKLKEVVEAELDPLAARDATLDPEAVYNLSPMHALAVMQSGFTAFGNLSEATSFKGRLRFGINQDPRHPRVKVPRYQVERALQELEVAPGDAEQAAPDGPFSEGLYFIGKSVWAKGHAKLMDLVAQALVQDGIVAKVTVYGSGPDRQAMERRAHLAGLASVIRFEDGIDHAKLPHYKTMVNPSVSEVLCTTVAEALAMGKFVICADHPSNAFFRDFRNCLMFRTAADFTKHLRYVTTHEPAPLTDQERHVLTWEAATERFVESSKLTYRTAALANENVDDLLYLLQRSLFDGETGDTLRKLMGAGPVAKQYQELKRQASKGLTS